MWERTTIVIAEMPELSKRILIFKMTGNGEIKKYDHPVMRNKYCISTSCGCTAAKWDPIKKELTVEFESGQVPIHLIQHGANRFTTTKTITITYVDNSTEQLKVTATIVKKGL